LKVILIVLLAILSKANICWAVLHSSEEGTESAPSNYFKKLYEKVAIRYEAALELDNSFQNTKALEAYRTLLISAKTAYVTTDLTDKKKLHEIIRHSERREKEISKYLEAVEGIRSQFKTVEGLSKWLRKNIHYKSDRIASDYW